MDKINSINNSNNFKNMKIAIVGLGVIGGSYGLGLKKIKCSEVFGVDIDTDTIKKAKEMGIIKDGATNGKEILGDIDLIILAIYPKLVVNFIKDNIDNFKKNVIITDVTGIKMPIIKDVEILLKDLGDIDFIFGHPMAGREKKGIDFASDEVFKGANYIITPTARNKLQNIKIIEDLAYSLGFKRVNKISPEFHDEMIGYTSQLTHALAVALINSDIEGRDTGKFIGDSFRDLTRIAKINEDLWSELFLENKENLLYSIKKFEEELNKIKSSLEKNDDGQLKELFKQSTVGRERLEKN
ncbi:MAG: prephenate dehydrogenase [Fusobacteriaceae bacterium]|jgi:prephenate dehydrogenase|nr:prephenate dehydrogenase [Fusobacteriaceae bacterium]